jgi:Zn-finger nucleic acid-binding protein
MNAWAGLPVWLVSVGLLAWVVAVFIWGLAKANYEEFRKIEGERDELRKGDAEKRKAIKRLLGEAQARGQALDAQRYDDYHDVTDEDIEDWIQKTYDLIEAAFGQQEAETFLSNYEYPFDQQNKRLGLRAELGDEGEVVISGAFELIRRRHVITMMRHFFSAKRGVTVDECTNCGGHWLDPGELKTIRTEYASEEERERAAAEYFSEIFDSQLAVHAETEEDLARARRIAYVFRFLCPSYYVPGKQDWGAF